MSEPPPPSNPPRAPRLEDLIEAMDRPLLGLAVAAMILYLIDLRGVGAGWGAAVVNSLTFLIDAVFVVDLGLKVVALGRTYTQTPWCLIDVLSCLPVLDALTNSVLPLPPVRFFRGLRILRILRGLRVLRALRTIPAFEQFEAETRASAGVARAQRAMNLGMLAMTGAMLVTVILVRRSLERDYVRRVDAALSAGVSSDRLADLGVQLTPPGAAFVHSRRALVDGRPRAVYFDLRPIDRQANHFEFFLTLGMMFAMLMFMYIMASHHMEVTQTQLRGLLNLALPRQVAERFVADPAAYNQKRRMPATILFMDFVGFTRTCEALAHDPDRLSAHLEASMDRLVGELARHDMIIDKFIGDAVMSFRGGPLVSGDPAEHARRAVQAALDSVTALAALDDPYFHRVKIGGASADDCLIGAFGTSARLSYTILGDAVNLAARLEPASAQCATQNLFDEPTYRLCAGRPEFVWRRWGRIRVEGKSEPIQVYEAHDARRFGDSAFVASFHLALEAFERHDFGRARDFFLLADTQRRGGDEPSRLYAHRCDALLLRGRPVGWEPVFVTHK